MARNTDIKEQLFEVAAKPVYLEGRKKPIPRYKAITGFPDGLHEYTFSVVSDQYRLITNQAALDMGKDIHQKLFPGASHASFEIFNVLAPKTKSQCQIDIIDKNYTMNIWKQEAYVPFVRIHNSYNRSRSLQFDIGFCRKLCDNGAIFEQNVIPLKFAHTRQALRLEGLKHIDVSHLKHWKSNSDKEQWQVSISMYPSRIFCL